MDPLIFHFTEAVPEEELLIVREEVIEQEFVFEEIFETPEIADATYTLQNMLDVGGVGNGLSSTSYDEKEMNRYSSEKSDSEEETESVEASLTRDLLQYGEHSKVTPSDHEMQPSTQREDSFTCDICFNSFPRKESLNKHRRTHLEPGMEKIGICFVCGMKFNNAHSLKNHEERHAAERSDSSIETRKHEASTKDESFNCDICNKKFSNMDNLTLHMCAFTKMETDIGNIKENSTTNVFSQECGLVTNQKGRSSERSYCCDTCGMIFLQKSFMKYHKLMHTGEKPHPCKECGIAFARRSSLKLHSLIHSQKKAITCEDCKKVFWKKSHLNKHRQVSVEEKPHSCKKCGEAFTRETCLKHHKRIHKEEKPFPCNVCKTTVFTMDDLVSHMHSHDDEKSQASSVPSESVHKESELEKDKPEHKQIYCICGICGETFASPDSFKNHKCTSEAQKSFKCNVCDKSFARRSNLTAHLRVHTVEKEKRSYACEECEKIFESPAGLRAHTLSHKRKKLLKSETCKKTSPAQRKETGQTIQSTTKNRYHCNNCSKKFSTKSHLTRHLHSVHAKQKISACQKKRTQAALPGNSDKQRVAHPKQKKITTTTTRSEQNETTAQPSGQTEENYSCNRCLKKFPRKLSLTKHLQLHTADNAFSCENCAKADS